MKLVVGLGNPGEKYAKTRHNVGFMVLDEAASRMVNSQWLTIKKFDSLIINNQQSIIFCKPQTFMNSSGEAVKKLVDFYKIAINDLWVIHDDLDIRLGEYKIQRNKGPQLHYGVNSVEESLGNKDFWRVRVGVDNRDPNNRISGEEYTLQDFTEDEKNILRGVANNAVNEILQRIDIV